MTDFSTIASTPGKKLPSSSIVVSAPSSAGRRLRVFLSAAISIASWVPSSRLKSEVSAWWKSRSANLDQDGSTPRAIAWSQPAARKTRLLVLPFENLSGDPTQDYLADGFTEEMITQLARLRPEQLAVMARATAMHYKGTRKRPDRIARELKLDYLGTHSEIVPNFHRVSTRRSTWIGKLSPQTSRLS